MVWLEHLKKSSLVVYRLKSRNDNQYPRHMKTIDFKFNELKSVCFYKIDYALVVYTNFVRAQ